MFSVPAPFDIGEHDNIVSCVYSHERDDPDHVIFQRLVEGDWKDVTAAQAAAQIRSVALGLIAEGVGPGDRVAVFSATRYEWPIIDFAILSVGALTVPIYETSSVEHVRHVLSDSDAVLVFAETDAHADKIEHLEEELPALRKVLRIASSGASALDELAEAGKSVDPAELDRRLADIKAKRPGDADLHVGHDGQAQGLPADARQPGLRDPRRQGVRSPTLLDKGERLLVFLPLAHVLARAITIARVREQGDAGFHQRHQEPGSDVRGVQADAGGVGADGCSRRSTTPPSRTPATTARAGSSRSRPTPRSSGAEAQDTADARSKKTGGGPGLLLRGKHAVFDRLVYGKLRAALGGDCHAAISGGAPLGARLGHFYRGVGLTIYEGYGLTETSAAITVNQIEGIKIGSVGKLLGGNSMRLNDDDELLVRGGVVFAGYWHNEQETAAAFSADARSGEATADARAEASAGSTPATSARSTTTDS